MVKQVQHCAHHFDGQHPESSCISLRTRALIILVCSLATRHAHNSLAHIQESFVEPPVLYTRTPQGLKKQPDLGLPGSTFGLPGSPKVPSFSEP